MLCRIAHACSWIRCRGLTDITMTVTLTIILTLNLDHVLLFIILFLTLIITLTRIKAFMGIRFIVYKYC